MNVFRKEVQATITIASPIMDVWAVLTDAQAYAAWNPILVPLSGEFRQGARLTYEMTGPDRKSSRVKSVVIRMVEGEELNQRGGIPGVLTFDHHWLLSPAPFGTQVTQYEVYRGIAVPFWNPGWVETAYREANEGLKERVLKLRT